ncbi:MAG: hypothetical protein RIT45_1937 [Pseudomonadota bacterium]|jgi:carboxyl-terminal processing protease
MAPRRTDRYHRAATRVVAGGPLRQRVIRTGIAGAAAVVATLALRALLATPPAAELPTPPRAAPPDPLAPLLVDSHARERRDRDRAVRALYELRIGSQALDKVRKRYVDPSRVDAAGMLRAGLMALLPAVPPLHLEDAEGGYDLRMGEDRLHVDPAEVTDLFRLDRALLRAMRFLGARIGPEVAAANLEYVAVNGMLRTLDPYSRMLDPDAWREMQTHTGGTFGGLGIRILVVDGVLTVVGVIEDSPAARAGLEEHDQIVQIDGEDTLNMGIDDAVERLRGKVGVPAQLLVKRQGWDAPRAFSVVRAVIQLKSVEGRLLDNGVGYARIKSFQRGTAKELERQIALLDEDGAGRGLVLDLRGNPGGLLEEAVRVVDLFVDRRVVVATVGNGNRREERRAKDGGVGLDLPLVVLVNRRSASASEIVAGALKHFDRAVIVGERSYGKGTVQVPFEIGDGALKLTVAQYLVGGEGVIQDRGVMPDVEIAFQTVRRNRVSLFDPGVAARRAQGEKHGDRPAHRLRIQIPIASERRPEEQSSPAAFEEAEPIRRAAELLRRVGESTASATLAQATATIAEMQEQDDKALTLALTRVGVDWRRGPRASAPKLALEVGKAGSKGRVVARAGAATTVPVTVRNLGREPLYRVMVQTRSDAGALDGVEAAVGRLLPGRSRTVSLRLRPSRRHLDVVLPVRVEALSEGSALGAGVDATVALIGRARPQLSFRYHLDSPDGVLEPGRRAALLVEVRNDGDGPSRRTVVSLRSLAGTRLHLEVGKAELGRIEPGGSAIARLELVGGPGKGRTSGLLEARLRLVDESSGESRQARVMLGWRNPGQQRRAEAMATVLSERMKRWNVAPRIRVAGADAGAPEVTMPAASTATDDVNAALRVEPLHGSCRLALRGEVRFPSGPRHARWAVVNIGAEKRVYLDGAGKDAVRLAHEVRLPDGLSRVTIVAQAGPDRVAQRALLVHCSGTAAAAEGVPASPHGEERRP